MFGFLLTSLLLEITPGPNMTYLATVAMSRGRASALMAVAGVALGLLSIGVLSAIGLAELLNAAPVAYTALRYGGIVYMLYLAWDIWSGAAQEGALEDAGFSSFRRGLFVNVLNPKAALFYVSVLPGFIVPSRGSVLVQNLQLVLIYVLVATSVHVSIVLFAARLRAASLFAGKDQQIARLMALSLVGVAAWLAWDTRNS